jgi:hypothetical protein
MYGGRTKPQALSAAKQRVLKESFLQERARTEMLFKGYTDSRKEQFFLRLNRLCVGWGSSVSIVSDCRLDRAIGVRSPAEAGDFSSSLFVQTSSEAHPASYPMGTGGWGGGGGQRPELDAVHSPPSSAEVRNE